MARRPTQMRHHAPAEREPDALPEVVISGRQVRELITESWHVLITSCHGPRLFRYGCGLARVVHDDRDETGIEPLDVTRLTGLLLRSADWVREDNERRYPARVPSDVARDMIALPLSTVPKLVGLIALPIVRSDGTVIAKNGFDSQSGLFCQSGLDLQLPDPTTEARVQALALLRDEVLGDFPFASDRDRAHALALLLLPLVRHLFDGPTPLYLIEAPSEGTGKTLLADVAHLFAVGRSVDPTTLPRREEEVRKKITALLLNGPVMILLDNVDRSLDSSALAAVLTRDRWADRLLGKSTVVHLPNRAVWVATANNPTMSRELSRRCCRIRLDSGVEQPWLREGFRHPNLTAWVQRERSALVSAGLTLIRGWLSDGAPKGTDSLGSFSAWAEVMGGILQSCGVVGFLDDRSESIANTDPDEAAWLNFVQEWWASYGETPVPGRALLSLALETGLWHTQSPNDGSERARFGIALSRRRDRIFGAHRLTVQRDTKRKQNRYVLALVPTS